MSKRERAPPPLAAAFSPKVKRHSSAKSHGPTLALPVTFFRAQKHCSRKTARCSSGTATGSILSLRFATLMTVPATSDARPWTAAWRLATASWESRWISKTPVYISTLSTLARHWPSCNTRWALPWTSWTPARALAASVTQWSSLLGPGPRGPHSSSWADAN